MDWINKTLILILMLFSLGWSAAPVAVVTVQGKTITNGHITVDKGETVQFYGDQSSDADGDTLQYYWTFGDGDPSAAPNPKHRYRNAGTYAVRLIVRDKKDEFPLLTGMTPASYTLPTGWTLVRAQDFEGEYGSGESTCGYRTTDKPHTGNRSLKSTVNTDDDCTGWKLGDNITKENELYLSWYEYIDEFGKNNDEMFLCNIRKNNTSPSSYLQIRWQYLNHLGVWSRAFNIDSGRVVLFAEGNAPGATPSRKYGTVWQGFGAGQWRQWEVYFRPASGGLQNGESRIYMNGILNTIVKDTAFNGTADMTGAAIYIGGPTYTKINWGSNTTHQCSQDAGHLDYSLSRPKDFNNPMECQNQAPPNGFVPIFNRYVDDIIILER